MSIQVGVGRMRRALSSLSPSAAARVRSAKAGAEETLGKNVVKFLRFCKADGERSLGRNPCSSDLLPFFETYSETVFDVEALERLNDDDQTVTDYVGTLKIVISNIVHDISWRRGTWLRVVRRACRIVNLGSWQTPYGTYTCADLLHRASKQLRAMLHLRAKHWEKQACDRYITAAATAPQSDRTSHQTKRPRPKVDQRFPDRARWLDSELNKRSWNKHDVARQNGPDHKTVQKVLDGYPVREDVIEKIARALSGKGLKVDVTDVPRS